MDIQYIYQINNLLNPDLTKQTIDANGEIVVEEEKEKKEKKKSQREIFFLKKKSKNTKK